MRLEIGANRLRKEEEEEEEKEEEEERRRRGGEEEGRSTWEIQIKEESDKKEKINATNKLENVFTQEVGMKGVGGGERERERERERC